MVLPYRNRPREAETRVSSDYEGSTLGQVGLRKGSVNEAMH